MNSNSNFNNNSNKNNNGNNNNKPRNNKQSQRGGRRDGYGRRSNNRWQNKPWSDRGDRQFHKFADIDHNKQSNYWPQNDWNCDNRNSHNYASKGSAVGSGIFPWIRNKPINPLKIHDVNFEQKQNDHSEEAPRTNAITSNQVEPEPLPPPTVANKKVDKEISSKNNSVPSESNDTSKLPSETNFSVQVKQEKDLLVNLKRERKSSSSSSSASSSATESNDEEPESGNRKADKSENTSSKTPSSPLNIKLKPKANPLNYTPVKSAQKLEELRRASTSSSSSSSASTSSDEVPEPSLDKKENLQSNKKEIKSSKKKISSEDDVVCIGQLENKIVLEDDAEETDSSHEETLRKKSNKKSKKSSKRIAEKCMLCEKKGHTAFQCQMICKNCSAPYHGYRTCPQPVNLNTMLQLFIEFCMQQLENFKPANVFDNAPKVRSDATHLTAASKSNKSKRKVKETNVKTKISKKRKISSSGSKKSKSKSDSDDSTDDDNDGDDTDSDRSSTEQEEAVSSSAESLVSSKRKRRTKSKTATKTSLNPISLPVVLNGFPNLTVPNASIQNPTTSSNALNTLLLTQMFQNAIGSLKK